MIGELSVTLDCCEAERIAYFADIIAHQLGIPATHFSEEDRLRPIIARQRQEEAEGWV
jgi:hypothetical protein